MAFTRAPGIPAVHTVTFMDRLGLFNWGWRAVHRFRVSSLFSIAKRSGSHTDLHRELPDSLFCHSLGLALLKREH